MSSSSSFFADEEGDDEDDEPDDGVDFDGVSNMVLPAVSSELSSESFLLRSISDEVEPNGFLGVAEDDDELGPDDDVPVRLNVVPRSP